MLTQVDHEKSCYRGANSYNVRIRECFPKIVPKVGKGKTRNLTATGPSHIVSTIEIWALIAGVETTTLICLKHGDEVGLLLESE